MLALWAATAGATPLALDDAELPNIAVVTAGIGTSDPFRPGLPAPTLDTGALILVRALEVRANIHREGTDAVLLRGTSSVTSLGLHYSPTWPEHPERLLRIGGGPWLLLDHQPAIGLVGEVAAGVQNRNGSVAGFVEAHPNRYAENGPLDGLTVGADLRVHHKVGLVGLRAGLAGLRRPTVALTVGAGPVWGSRPLGPI